jgi:tRNA nucleotidyltransferase/poly(A) polymerase
MKPDVIRHLMTPAVVALNKAVTDAGFELRIVGGAVRDLVQGIDPKDIDMASDARPEQMMSLLDKVGIRHEPTGLEHGTITVILDGEPIEITTLRIDTDQDGRHATVQFTNDWRKDAERRDLTFNAMSMEMDGTLHDYFDGVEDINNGVARFVGDADARLQEDFLRILRYFRFQGRLNSPSWDAETMDAVERNAGGLEGISGERIWAEMEKILSQPSRVDVLRRMNKTDVLDGIDMPVNRIGMVKGVSGMDPVVALSAALNTQGGLDTLRRRWKFSNEVHAKLTFILAHRHKPMDETLAQRMLADPKMKTAHVMALLEAMGKGVLADKMRQWTPPEFPVNGSDLLAAGVPSGPAMGRQLAQLRDAWEQSGFELDKAELLKEL